MVMISEKDYKVPYAKRVVANIVNIDSDTLKRSMLGIQLQLNHERYPARKKLLKKVLRDLKMIDFALTQ